jgi:hypothetical protein
MMSLFIVLCDWQLSIEIYKLGSDPADSRVSSETAVKRCS